jgi:hypothetical protein
MMVEIELKAQDEIFLLAHHLILNKILITIRDSLNSLRVQEELIGKISRVREKPFLKESFKFQRMSKTIILTKGFFQTFHQTKIKMFLRS